MLGLLLFIIWLIPLVAFLLRNALCSELVKHIQKGNRLYQICAAICVVGIVAWGGVKPNMSMNSNSTAQNINGTNINTLNSTIGANSSTSFTDAELASRLVFLDGGTNSTFIATPPENAVINQKWTMTGAAEDFVIVSPTNWAFPVNDKVYSNLFVSTTGNISFEKPITRTNAFTNQYTVLSPFRSVQGVLPYHLWNELGTDKASRFWYAQTEYNSLLLTWENFLYSRHIDYPISYQAELYSNGEFDFRYDLSSLQSNPTNAFAGYQSGNVANKYASLTPYTKSINAKRLNASVANNQDSDLDGILDSDEVFLFGTDPTLADSDFDGMNDGAEIVAGNNPLNPDEDGDGNRDYLTPEISNPNGLVVASPWQASAVFVFNTNLSAGEFATLVIDFTTVIPLSNQSQVYLNLEQGRLYNYKIYSSRNIVAEYAFRNLSEVSQSYARMNSSDSTKNGNIFDIINETAASETSKIIFSEQNKFSNSAPLSWEGYVGDVILAFVHLPNFTDYPLSNPCLHGKESISFELKAFPSELLNLGEITDVENLEYKGNNIYTLVVDGSLYYPSTGSISFTYKERNNTTNYISLFVYAHQCDAGDLCNGCGVHHNTNDGCEAHNEDCNLLFSKTEECSCEYTFAEICFDDCNNNGIEDRFEYCGKGLFSLYVLDPVDDCCCTNWNTNAVKEFSTFEIVTIPDNITFTTNTASSVLFIPKEPSGELGYTPITYDVYGRDGKKTTTVTKKIVVGGAEFLFDYNDDGQVNNADKVLQKQYTNTNYYIYASPKKRPARVRVEMPPNVSSTLQSSDEFSFYTSSNGSLISQPMSLSNGTNMVYLQTAITNSLANINLECGSHLSKDNQFSIVKTALSDIETKFAKEITLPYYGSGIENQVDIYNYRTGALVDSFISDGKWVVYLAEGEYRLVVHYNDIYKNGIKGFFEECKLSVIGSNSIAGDYGLKCGTNNFLRIDLLNIDNLPFDITWKISPNHIDGAKLSVSEDVDDAAHQIISNASSIYIHAGTETNNYTISGWMGNTEVVSSTNISVHVFPYEIDTPDQIVRSHSIKSAQIGVETLSEYSNHKWKLTKTYDFDGNTTQKSFIGTNINDINYVDITGFKIYFGSNKAGEKYNLTATHELYTNVTDTVELRTCDIFFNPISCKLSPNGDIINPRTILHGDDFSTYELTVFPDDFLTSKVEWETHQNLVVNEDNDKNLTIGIKSLIPYSQAYQATLTINIPDYYETPPTTKIYVYNKLDVVNIELVIVKYNDSQYINYNEDNVNASEYDFSSANDFYSVFSTNFNEQLSYANKVFRQAGIQFKVSNTNEIVNSDIFFFSTTATNTPIQSLLPSYNGIRVFVVDSITNANYYAITRHNNDWSKLYGIVLTKDMPVQTLAHELGHAFSLNDIYDHNSTVTLRRIPPNGHLTQDFTGEINYYNSELYDIVTACLMNGTDGDNPDIRNTILPIGRILGFKAINNSGCENCFNKLEDNESINCTTCLGDIRVGISNMIRNITTYGEGNE